MVSGFGGTVDGVVGRGVVRDEFLVDVVFEAGRVGGGGFSGLKRM